LMLKEYNYARFHHLLQRMHFDHLSKPANHYGLSLILGGGESTLWEVAQAYSGMAQQLTMYSEKGNTSFPYCMHWRKNKADRREWQPALTAGALFATFNALVEVNRPEEEWGWEEYSSTFPIAWKTGTSFGNRDAWAVGSTPEYVVAVWVGNADGTGRPELTGVNAAAPLMFDIFNVLPSTSWWIPPAADMRSVQVCRQSGKLATANCPDGDQLLVPSACEHGPACDAHIQIQMNATGTRRVNADCYPTHQMTRKTWFRLSPVQAWYFARRHPEYNPLPDWESGCNDYSENAMGWIYPKGESEITLPRSSDGGFGKLVLEIAHRQADAVVHWHLDEHYLGATHTWHQMEAAPGVGQHFLYLTDEQGHELVKRINVR
jgi:penicillin-binding protein 1C